MGIAAAAAHMIKKGTTKSFNVVICPSHITKKWVREIEETVHNSKAVVVTSVYELNQIYEAWQRNPNHCFVVFSKEKARDGYMRRPAAVYAYAKNKHGIIFPLERAFVCPICGETIQKNITQDSFAYKVNVNSLFFKKENRSNHQCEHCKSPLWTVLNPDEQTDWVKIGNYGFVHRAEARKHLQAMLKGANAKKQEKIMKGTIYKQITEVLQSPDAIYKAKAASRRFALSSYIKQKMKGRIDYVIVDELHQYALDSGQGEAAAELIKTAKYAIGLTGTLFNGYASGIFKLLFRICPELMIFDGQSYNNPTHFNTEYGVTETEYKISEADYNANRRTAKRKIQERQRPGISPLVYARFLIEHAVFMSLDDMGRDLPEYEEIPVPVKMNEQVSAEYERIKNKAADILKNDKKIARKVMSALMNLMLVYPDMPYGQKPVYDPFTDNELLIPRDTADCGTLHDKDTKLLALVEKKIQSGEKVLIYTNWVRTDTQQKLSGLLKEKGYAVETLTSSVKPEKREEWVDEKLESGIQILIMNPKLCETGIDLLAFTTLIFYDIGYNLFTLRQAARRSWRINQTASRVEVYFFYDKSTMQESAVRLMATKVAVSGILEGQISDEGLAAMGECQDLTTIMAQELTHGIRDEVEDLGSVFKKMAYLKKSERGRGETLLSLSEKHHNFNPADYLKTPELQAAHIVTGVQKAAENKPIIHHSVTVTEGAENIILIPSQTGKKKSGMRKQAEVFDGQISLEELHLPA